MRGKIVSLLEENKAQNIQTFVCKNYIAQNVIIATMLNGVHCSAVAGKIMEMAKGLPFNCDGKPQDGWIAIEVENVIAHLMTQEKREHFRLEEFIAQNAV